MVKWVLALTVVLAIGIPSVAQQKKAKAGGNVQQEITALNDQSVQEAQKGETGFVEKYYTDDAVIIHSDGKLIGKAQEIDSMKSGALKYQSIEVRQRSVRVYGDTAVSVAETSVKGVLGGKPIDGTFISTRTWAKRDGTWKVVAYQATRAAGQ